LSQFINSIKDVKKNYTKYDGWEQNQADDAAKREHLSKTLELPKDKVELTEAKAKNVIRAAEILDKKSEDNCENTEQSTGIISMFALLPPIFALQAIQMKLIKSNASAKVMQMMSLAQVVAPFALGAGLILWANNKQKEASRIGRFQAKQHELKDVKNFVNYTPEQIEAAKILVKNMPDKKDKKGIFKAFSDMKQMSLDKKDYKKWLEAKIKNPEDVQKLLNTKFTPEQIAQGEEDKEIIVNIVKDINIEAENYSENMENASDTLTMLSAVGSIPIGIALNKIIKNIKNIPQQVRGFVPVAAGMIFTLGVLFWGTAEQKKASRVGRFVKRKEILSNTKVLMAYTDEQLKQAENIKAPIQKKGFFEKIGGNFKFLGTYLKDKKAYNKYIKTEAKENEKLYEALGKSEVSTAQLTEAKHLQEKTFKAFDKVDEMSQRYSEDIEAGSEIAKNSVNLVWYFTSVATMALLPVLTLKGKLPVHKIAKQLSKFTLDKNSSIRLFVDKAYEVISKDKDLKQDLSKAILDSKARTRLSKNSKISDLLPEAKKAWSEIQNFENLKAHFKKDGFSKWVRNLVTDIGKFKIGSSIKNKLQKEYIDELLAGTSKKMTTEEFNEYKTKALEPFKFKYKNYKTLINSLFIGAVPMSAFMLGVPFAFSSWLTNIQKKAGKIGIMKAMEEIDNPKFFVNAEASKTDETKK